MNGIYLIFLLFISNISASTLEVVQDPYRTEVSYAQATLKNGVNIVIEKDPLLSSADLIFVVNAGSRHDGDHLGLAHLLEHMMFQGSKKYPKVNGFHDFIDRAAGRTNAFTEPEYTLYYMNMNVDDFPEGIDRFSSTVADPMFDEKGIQKEKNSVNEEYLLSKNQDGFIQRTLSNRLIYKDKERQLFYAGSLESLKSVGQKELKAFYQKYYIPSKMTVWVRSPLNINDVFKDVKNAFSGIKDHNINQTIDSVPSFNVNLKNNNLSVVRFQSNQKNKKILISIPTQPMWGYDLGVINFYEYLFNKHDKNSLYDVLKEKGWIIDLGAHFDIRPDHNRFNIYLQLTDKGALSIDEILNYTKEYISFLNSKSPRDDLYRIYKESLEYRISSEPIPMSMHSYFSLAIISKFVPIKSTIRLIPERLNKVDYQKLVKAIDFDHAAVVIMDPSLVEGKPVEFYTSVFKDQHYRMKDMVVNYAYPKYSQFSKKNQEQGLEKSCFELKQIGRDFFTQVLKSEVPENTCITSKELSNEQFSNQIRRMAAWDKINLKLPYGEFIVSQGPVLGKNDGIISILLKTPEYALKEKVMMELVGMYYGRMIDQNFSEAISLGYSISVVSVGTGLKVIVRGPKNHLFDVFEDLNGFLREKLSIKDFDQIKQFKIRNHESALSQTGASKIYDQMNLMLIGGHSHNDHINQLNNINVDQLQLFKDSVINNSFMYGVILLDNPVDVIKDQFDRIYHDKRSNDKKSGVCWHFFDKDKNVLKVLSDKEQAVLRMSQSSSSVEGYKQGIYLNLFNLLVGNSFYSELRTQKQLGYVVNMSHSVIGNVFPLLFSSVISNKNSIKTIKLAVDDFYESILSKIAKVEESEFVKARDSLVQKSLYVPNLDLYAQSLFSDEFVLGHVSSNLEYGFLKHLTFDQWRQSIIKYFNNIESLDLDYSKDGMQMDELLPVYKNLSSRKCVWLR